MANTLNVEVITPDATVFQGEATQIILTSGGGAMGILPDHAPLVATLDLGPARVDLPDGGQVFLMVGDGFLEVRDNQVKVLAQVGERDEQIDVERAERSIDRAKERLARRAEAKTDIDFDRVERSLARARIRVKILRDLAPHKRLGQNR